MPTLAASRTAAPRAGGLPVARGVQRFFLYLTPGRALLLFSVGLAAGIALIVAPEAPLWAPIVPVVLYAAGLLYAQGRFLVRLDGTLKDSPYFLGFILTLFALYDTFTQLAASSAGAVAVGIVVGKAGAAILPTVAGLFLRQVLLSLDASEHAGEALFQSMAQEIRDRAAEFQRMHAGFLDLIREFTASREGMFAREEVAFARYVERLEAGASTLGALQEAFPARAQELLGSVEGLARSLRLAGAEAARQVEGWDERWRTQAEDLRQRQLAETEEAGRAATAARDGLRREMDELVSLVTTSVPTIATHVRGAELALGEYAEGAQRLAGSLEGVRERADGAGEALAAITQGAAAAGATLQRAAGEMTDQAGELFRERLAAARADLQAIDRLVDELAAVLARRIERGATP
jgi:hypothetical protein